MSHDFPGDLEDGESAALFQNRSFWRLYDRALERGEQEGWTPLEELTAGDRHDPDPPR